jgi:hypothetical protein
MLNISQFRELIVKSTLNDLLLYSENAEELMVFTCAVESLGGHYLKQVSGPALGIYQMEPVTYNDIWQTYIKSKGSLMLRLLTNFSIGFMPSEEQLIYDLRFATAMTRIFYERIKESLPAASNVDAIWNYYKKYYNTSKGAAQKDDSIKKYHDFISH